MTEISTYKDELYEIYELHHAVQTTATSPDLTVTGKKPHADVIAVTGHKLKRTRVYVNGKRATITEVALSTNDTVISVSDTIVSGDNVDIFLATTTGTLDNNTTTGKIPATCDQMAQTYAAESNEIDIGACGTERFETVRFSDDGMGTLAFKRQGNVNMQNFILAKKNKIYLMIIVKDTTAASATYDILHECRIATYARSTQAGRNRKALIVDTFEFSFVPPVPVTA